jgi:hypothetical protein
VSAVRPLLRENLWYSGQIKCPAAVKAVDRHAGETLLLGLHLETPDEKPLGCDSKREKSTLSVRKPIDQCRLAKRSLTSLFHGRLVSG